MNLLTYRKEPNLKTLGDIVGTGAYLDSHLEKSVVKRVGCCQLILQKPFVSMEANSAFIPPHPPPPHHTLIQGTWACLGASQNSRCFLALNCFENCLTQRVSCPLKDDPDCKRLSELIRAEGMAKHRKSEGCELPGDVHYGYRQMCLPRSIARMGVPFSESPPSLQGEKEPSLGHQLNHSTL
jgi:hypothetical protein